MSTCTATHTDYGYGYRPNVITPCFREVGPDGRHRGQHQGWQDMPAGQTTRPITGEVETWGPWRRLWTWNEGGAMGSARGQDEDREPCPLCGVLVRPCTDGGFRYPGAPDAYAVPDQNLGGACFDCRLWADRIVTHTGGWRRQRRGPLERSVRYRLPDGSPHPRLSYWVDGRTGAFDGRPGTGPTVTWDDGDTRGPDSCLWDAGAIPWWLDDEFPPNATVTWGNR